MSRCYHVSLCSLQYEVIDKICMYKKERSHAYISAPLHIHKV